MTGKRIGKNTSMSRFGVMLTAMAASACMLAVGFVGGGLAYGAEPPAGNAIFDYNGYSAAQLKAIGECIADIPGATCPSYSASGEDHYTGTIKHANMPTGVISTREGWMQWADAAMKANDYDGIYGSVSLSSANDPTHSVKDGKSTVLFRLVGINKDNRADGRGKAGLTFQGIGYYAMPSSYYGGDWNRFDRMNSQWTNVGGWRDSELRKSMNNGIIWKAFPSDFKDNVVAVNKTTNNHANYYGANAPYATSTTADKLWILSPSEMGMPLSRKGTIISNGSPLYQAGADVHVYGGDGGYDNTVKSTGDGNTSGWYSEEDYLYSDDAYQWWMLPAGDRKMSDKNQSYHNTDSVSYCAVAGKKNPSSNTTCYVWGEYFWLRSPRAGDDSGFAYFYGGNGYLGYDYANGGYGVVPAFSF